MNNSKDPLDKNEIIERLGQETQTEEQQSFVPNDDQLIVIIIS